MATQGIVSFTKNGKVIAKVVAGSDGYNAEKLALKIDSINFDSIKSIYDAAAVVGFGSIEDRVVITQNEILYLGSADSPDELYRETFNDPNFNPRWHCGTADHVVVIKFADDLDDEFNDYSERCECGVIGCPECDQRYYENFPCGKMSNGLCLHAGSEECSFDCPNR